MIKNTINPSKIMAPASSSPPDPVKSPNRSSQLLPSLVFIASRKMPTIAKNTIIIKTTFHPPSRYIGSPSLWKAPTSSKNKTARNNTMTAFAETVVMISTNCEEATTKNAMTKDAIALRFFFVYFLPSMSSVPSTLVFSRMAKTIVNTSKKGSTTSNKPMLSKNCKTCLKGVTETSGVAMKVLRLKDVFKGCGFCAGIKNLYKPSRKLIRYVEQKGIRQNKAGDAQH